MRKNYRIGKDKHDKVDKKVTIYRRVRYAVQKYRKEKRSVRLLKALCSIERK